MSIFELFVELSVSTSSKVVFFFSTKCSNGKTSGGLSVIGLGRDCFKFSAAADRIEDRGIFTEFGLSKVVNKHTLGLIAVSRCTVSFWRPRCSKRSALPGRTRELTTRTTELRL